MKEKLVKKTVYLPKKLADNLDKISDKKRQAVTRIIETAVLEHLNRQHGENDDRTK